VATEQEEIEEGARVFPLVATILLVMVLGCSMVVGALFGAWPTIAFLVAALGLAGFWYWAAGHEDRGPA
jgi:hypothetical protein